MAISHGPLMSWLTQVAAGAPWLLSTMRQPVGFTAGKVPPLVVGRLPTTTQPPGSTASPVVRPTPPGHGSDDGSVPSRAKGRAEPSGEISTMVLPVPCTLALLLKLLTRTSPRTSLPAVCGTTATPYGLMSPFAGTVLAIWLT